MKKYTKHISLCYGAISSNIWLMTDHDQKRFLIDTGHRLERAGLNICLKRSGITGPGDLDGVLLTHRHCDHAGNAQWLKEKFQCPVYCHENDAPYLMGEKNPAPLKRGMGNIIDEILCGIEDRHPSKASVDETFAFGPWKYGFEIIPAFGHTEGSVMILHKGAKVLFSGDVLLSGPPPFRYPAKLFLAVNCYSTDVKKCRKAVTDFLIEPPTIDILCSGHGPIIKNNTQEKLRKFAKTLVTES